jgi:hypothetical protein
MDNDGSGWIIMNVSNRKRETSKEVRQLSTALSTAATSTQAKSNKKRDMRFKLWLGVFLTAIE